MSLNKSFNKAKKKKNDEFYTRIYDIENELKHYKTQLKGKSILMPCDDPELIPMLVEAGDTSPLERASQFWVFFHMNFKNYGLKKITATHYEENGKSYAIEYTGGADEDIEVFKKVPLKGDGDFRSQEVQDLYKNNDTVITNPPFSLFREFIANLVKNKNKFLIIGNENAVSYKDVFKLFQEDKVWFGYNNVKTFMTVVSGKDKKLRIIDKKFGNVTWYTNLNVNMRDEELILFEKYSANKYPQYDNIDAINVDKLVEIPIDYDKPIGVPLSFIKHYNPRQFKLLGIDRYYEGNKTPNKRGVLNGHEKYARLIIERR